MRWRNPNEEMPEPNQIVWVMVEPHKDRGSLLKSAPSIEVACGWVSYSTEGKCRVDNADELGHGAIGWQLGGKNEYGYDPFAIAWLPVEEMPLPSWIKK